MRYHIISAMAKGKRKKGDRGIFTITNASFVASDDLRRPLRPHMPVTIRIASNTFDGKVQPIGKAEYGPGDSGYIQLHILGDSSCQRGIRFELFDKSGENLLGNGEILIRDVPLLKTAGIEAVIVMLDSVAGSDDPGALRGLIKLHHPKGVSVSYLNRAINISIDEINEFVYSDDAISKIPLKRDTLLMDDNDIAHWGERIIRLVKEYHIAEPYKPGPDLEYLETNLKPAPARAAVSAILKKSVADKLLIEKNGCFCSPDFVPGIEDDLDGIKGEAFKIYDDAGFSPPRLREAASVLKQPEKRLLGILMHLCEKGYMSRLDKDTFISRDHFEKARDKALKLIAKQGDIDLHEFRDLTGCNRRISVLICERFDKKGWTERSGGVRKAGPKTPSK